ncbi:MAG: DUF488 domain-containing protein [Thermodesulfobacteriota bacterium]
MKLNIKRVYIQPSIEDGQRILIDRLWPRGLNKEKAEIDLWLKEIAPSTELRKWFNHEQEKWGEFKKKYFKELESNTESVKILIEKINKSKVTILYSSKEERLNNAVALKEFIETYISPER